MAKGVKKPTEHFLRVENYACSVSLNKNGNIILFHCLIDSCVFKSKTLEDIISHLDDHSQVRWHGFCNICNSQIRNGEGDLLYELYHFSEKHYDRVKFLKLKDDKEGPLTTASKRHLNGQPNTQRSKQTERPLTAGVESFEVDSLTRHISILEDKTHSSEDPTMIIGHNSDPTSYESCSISGEPLNDECMPVSTSTLYENCETLNDGTSSIPQTKSNEVITISDGEDEPAKKKPMITATYTLTKGPLDKSSDTIVHYKCEYCPLTLDSPDKVYNHWKEKKDGPKFLFTIEKVFKCFYCRTCGTYTALKGHSKSKHEGNIFAMVDNFNRKRCGLGCGTIEKKMDDHFRENHKQQRNETEITLGDDLTDELLDNVIAKISEVNTRNGSPDIEMNDPIMFRCSKCAETNKDESVIAEHMRSHFIEFKCEYENCKKRFHSELLLKEHVKHLHSSLGISDDETYPNIDIKEYLPKYESMQIIFPSGLLLTKRECKKTKHGSMENIINIVREIDKKDLDARKQKQKEKRDEDKKESASKVLGCAVRAKRKRKRL